MQKEIYKLLSDNKPLPDGTKIRDSSAEGSHELSENVFKSANKCPNHMSDYVPFWILGWRDLYDDLILPDWRFRRNKI